MTEHSTEFTDAHVFAAWLHARLSPSPDAELVVGDTTTESETN